MHGEQSVTLGPVCKCKAGLGVDDIHTLSNLIMCVCVRVGILWGESRWRTHWQDPSVVSARFV